MKKYFIIFYSLIIYCCCSGQSLVVEYEYAKHVKRDSTRIIKQNTFLNITSDKSLFFSEAPYLADSIMTAQEQRGEKINFKGLPLDFLNCQIEKDLINKQITYYSDEFDEKEFTYNESPNYNWKVTKETKKIMGYNVYLAKTNYAGRNYSAFFTTEIPIYDGPYKFFGLPGLILELYDDKMDHHFLAIAISKNKKISLEERVANKKYIPTTKEKFLKMRESYTQAPLQRMFELMNSTGIYEKKDSSGNTVDLRKLFNESQQKMIKEYQSENKIEL